MTYETNSRKGFGGWEAISEAVLGETPEGSRILKLRTSKIRGGIASSANVFVRQVRGGFSSDTYAMFSDFYKREVASVPCNRVSEKAVLEVHSCALQEMDSLINEAKAFYAAKESQAA